jgi:hypothetical protein
MPPKRGWFRVGPGLFMAILASVAVWAFMPREPERPKVQSAPLLSVPASAPDPHWLLHQGDALRLTSVQTAKLTRLVSRWDRDTKDLSERLRVEAEAFGKGMADKAGKPANVQAVKQAAEPVSILSRQLSDARQAWWDDAKRVLEPVQQSRAEEAWAGHWTAPGTNRGRK